MKIVHSSENLKALLFLENNCAPEYVKFFNFFEKKVFIFSAKSLDMEGTGENYRMPVDGVSVHTKFFLGQEFWCCLCCGVL